jgi:hypothetical protein
MTSSSQAITTTVRNSNPFARCIVLIDTRPVAGTASFGCAGCGSGDSVLSDECPLGKSPKRTGRGGEVNLDSVWIDTVKYGNLPINVRALGSLTTPTTAQLSVPSQLPTQLSNALQIGQSAIIDMGNTITVAGKVTRVDAASANGTVPVTVEIRAPMAEFAGHAVDGTVQIKTLHDVVFVGRPANVGAFAETMMFKLETDGQHWSRAKVRFGPSSVNTIQVVEGLQHLRDLGRGLSLQRMDR